MINAGKYDVVLNDGWTVVTKDKSSVQFEHTAGIIEKMI